MELVFPTVNEDSRVESKIFKDFNPKKSLFIASGGCTALNLKSEYPNADIDLVDMNAEQLEHVKQKVEILERNDAKEIQYQFNIDARNADAIHSKGTVSLIFRAYSALMQNLVASKETFVDLFSSQPYRDGLAKELVENKYWPVVFEMLYDSSLLNVFSSSVLRVPTDVKRNSDRICENTTRCFLDSHICQNYYLHFIVLGHYLEHALPPYLTSDFRGPYDFNYFNCALDEVPELEQYDFLHLSNICDWMSPEMIKEFFSVLAPKLKKGARVLLRCAYVSDTVANNVETSLIYEPTYNDELTKLEAYPQITSHFLFTKQ